MSDETWDDAPCTDCGDTGITYQTERVCSCLAGLAIEMIDADACPSPTDRISSLESQLLAAERERDALREALRNALASLVAATSLLERGGKKAAPSDKMFAQMLVDYNKSAAAARAALTANHSAPVVEE